MFDYCSLVQKKCSYASKVKDITYCGLHTGNKEQNRVDYIKVCPKEKIKKRRQLCPIIMEQKRRRRKRKKGRKNESESTKRVSLYEKEGEV